MDGDAVTPGARMPRRLAIVDHPDRRTGAAMPQAPAIVLRRGQLVFVSGVTAAPVYQSHPHRDEAFDLPRGMREARGRGTGRFRTRAEADAEPSAQGQPHAGPGTRLRGESSAGPLSGGSGTGVKRRRR
jgi:hypothetical protein